MYFKELAKRFESLKNIKINRFQCRIFCKKTNKRSKNISVAYLRN